jgi:arylsulfatase A-like enzyme
MSPELVPTHCDTIEWMITRRHFAGTLAGAALVAQSRPKPNIVFILADDLGYGDLGCYGQRRIHTPNLDRLAASGIRFTQAYAGSTVCAPSRCCLMTGLHTGHAYIRGNAKVDLRPSDRTVAEVLQTAGYRTAAFGKWGLGTAGNSGIPNRKGFDEWFGYLDQTHAHTYYPTQLWDNEKEFFLRGNFGPDRSDYSHDLFTDRALKFIEKQRAGSPFFLYLPYTIPHANNEGGRQSGNGMDVPSDEPYSRESWPQPEKNFAAMITRMDRDIGLLMESLRKSGLAENTVVMFTSDNGPHREGGHDPDYFQSRGPLRGIKRDLYDGGIRVPAIAAWPGTIRPGQTSDAVWAFWDVLPSFAELAGATVPSGLDGVSFVPALRGGRMPARECLYWEFHEQGFSQAVRMERWKAVRPRKSTSIELYDVVGDTGEQQDVASGHPNLVRRAAELMKSNRTESELFQVRT